MNPIALLGIFLLFFIGLAMFCKVPVAYSIGSLLGGRDHSTIIHGIKKIADEYDSNEQTRNLIETIKKKINPN